jgi:hypothetical protein
MPAMIIRRSRGGLLVGFVAACALVLCVRCLDIARIYNHTFDEPTQIASGLELWQYGTFELHTDVPPLAKLLISGPAYAAGVRLAAPPHRGDWIQANALLYGSGRYWFILRSARAINTTIGMMLVVALAWYAWNRFGGWAAAAAAVGAAASPGLVSAASIANSDVLGTFTVLATCYAFRRLLLDGTWRWRFAFAFSLAAALATKLSALPFLGFGLPVIAALTLGSGVLHSIRHPLTFLRGQTATILIVVLVVPLLVWFTYGFHLAPLVSQQAAAQVAASLLSSSAPIAHVVGDLPDVPLPLGGFVRGLAAASTLARVGHPAYLMGHFTLHGWAYYFLVTLLLKVPIGTLCGVLIASVLAIRWRRTAEGCEVLLVCALCLAMLASVARAGVNAGHRHILPVEVLLAVVVAGGVRLAQMERPRNQRLAFVMLTAAVLGGTSASLRAYSDALGYTNALAGTSPDWWFIDSNLDWGQDLERLRAELVQRGVSDEVQLAYFGTADPLRHGIRFRPLPPSERVEGWVAVSVSCLRGLVGGGWGRLPDEDSRSAYQWLLDEVPVTRIGTSMRLYHLEGTRATALSDHVSRARLADGGLNGACNVRDEPVESMKPFDSFAPLPPHSFAHLGMSP